MPAFKTEVPQVRVRKLNCSDWVPDSSEGYVVYWMTAFRRPQYNFSLQYACDVAAALGSKLLVLEALRVGYRWASHRMHRFVVEGIRDNQNAFRERGVAYLPYVETQQGEGSGLIESLSKQAAAVVTDDYPCFFHPALLRIATRRLTCPLIAVDSNCLMPLAVQERTFTVAHSYRRYMQKELPKHLEDFPSVDPTSSLPKRCLGKAETVVPARTLKAWPASNIDQLLNGGLEALPIDQQVGPGVVEGGFEQADALLADFVSRRLSTYDEQRNQPDEVGSSQLSPHLHFGHISCHQVFSAIMASQKWTPGRLNKPNGKVNGFWGVSQDAEAFLDQLCSWREIGFNMSHRETAYRKLSSLPDWVQKTMDAHRDDPREHTYTLEQFESAQTHDEIWNSAQRQLVREGRIHNYLRMLWGKKILQWTKSPEEALDVMVHLNNKYALDGRDPNSYSGIFWVLGRYDRAWGPERPVFGKLRYMTSENTAKKVALKKYLRRFAEG